MRGCWRTQVVLRGVGNWRTYTKPPTLFGDDYKMPRGAQWHSGRVSDSGARGRGPKPISSMLCPLARHFTPRKYWYMSGQSFRFLGIEYTLEAVAPTRHDCLLTGTLCLNTNKQTKLFCRMLIIYLGANNGPQQWQASVLQLCYPSPYIMLQCCHLTVQIVSIMVNYSLHCSLASLLETTARILVHILSPSNDNGSSKNEELS